MSGRMRITTVTLNAAVDKTYYLRSLDKGKVARADKVLAAAGGKGVNVARVLRQLGHEQVTATGFIAGYNGRFIAEQVRQLGISEQFVPAAGESRLCLNFIDGTDGSSTEVLEPGPELSAQHAEQMRDKLRLLAAESRIVIFSGSIPQGLPTDLYADLIRIAAAGGADVFLDAGGAPLAKGLDAGPLFIKPNEDEILPWMSGTGEHATASALRALMDIGISHVVVTLGADGALAGIRGRVFRVRIPRIQAVNTVGCGDAFVAGFAYAYARDWTAEQSLRHAAAAGCANALSPIAGDVRMSDHERMMQQVTVEAWDG